MAATIVTDNIYRQVWQSTTAADLTNGALLVIDTTIPVASAGELSRVGAYVTLDIVTGSPVIDGALSVNPSGNVRLSLQNLVIPSGTDEATCTVEIVMYHTRVQANDNTPGATGFIQILKAFQ